MTAISGIEMYSGVTTEEYLDFYRDAPQEFLVETVGPCNLRCIGCPQSLKEYQELKSKPAFMDFSLYVSILKQIAKFRPVNVGLYHTGEITLMSEEQFNVYTKAAKEFLTDSAGWTSVGFYTNGTKLTKDKIDSIINNGINWVRLSFDGGTKEAYEKVRVGAKFEEVRANALALSKAAAKSGREMRLEIIFVPYVENELTVGEFHKLWEGTGWKHYTGGTMNYGGLMEDAVSVRRHRYQRSRRVRHSVPCPRVFEQFSILVDGRVSLCSADPMGKMVLGDLTKQTIEEVFNGEIRRSVIKKHIDKKSNEVSPCNVCDYVDYCAVPSGNYFGEVNES